eukprot:gb/GECH01005247.1/.p1 GENE.gb/GECH01005247.1/~~gb/GECH01005247.1/.p1  ORF type:complete len:191 (+),score=61.07 gb/GECH01005247.1/:1-573(+)
MSSCSQIENIDEKRLSMNNNNNNKYHQNQGYRDILTKEMARMGIRFAWYLAAFFLTWLFGLIHRIYNLFYPGDSVDALIALNSFFSPLGGFLNMLAYGMNYYGAMAKWMKRKWKIFKNKDDINHDINDDDDELKENSKEHIDFNGEIKRKSMSHIKNNHLNNEQKIEENQMEEETVNANNLNHNLGNNNS